MSCEVSYCAEETRREGRERRTASAPCLFFHGMQRGKWAARS